MAIINSTEYPVGTVYKYNNTILQVSYVDNPCGESDYCKDTTILKQGLYVIILF